MSSLWQYSGVPVLKVLERRRVGEKPLSVAIYSWPHGKVRRPFCLIYVRYALFKFKLNIILKQVAIRTILVKVKNNVWLIFKIMLKCVHRKYRYLELYIFSGLKSFKKCNNRIHTVVPTQWMNRENVRTVWPMKEQENNCMDRNIQYVHDLHVLRCAFTLSSLTCGLLMGP